jgi:hypothetical protein
MKSRSRHLHGSITERHLCDRFSIRQFQQLFLHALGIQRLIAYELENVAIRQVLEESTLCEDWKGIKAVATNSRSGHSRRWQRERRGWGWMKC